MKYIDLAKQGGTFFKFLLVCYGMWCTDVGYPRDLWLLWFSTILKVSENPVVPAVPAMPQNDWTVNLIWIQTSKTKFYKLPAATYAEFFDQPVFFRKI